MEEKSSKDLNASRIEALRVTLAGMYENFSPDKSGLSFFCKNAELQLAYYAFKLDIDDPGSLLPDNENWAGICAWAKERLGQ